MMAVRLYRLLLFAAWEMEGIAFLGINAGTEYLRVLRVL